MDGKYENGVGFVMNENILSNVKKDVKADNDRLYHIRIAGRIFDTFIINAYTLTEEKGEDIKNDFYKDLNIHLIKYRTAVSKY